MFDNLSWTATAVFVFFFAAVTVLGFMASNWKSGDLDSLDQWGLGGRQFGTVITWFLLGGDIYTAYTIIAVPAVVYSIGAYGFFAVPYTILIYPILFLVIPKLWNVSHKKGYITGSDYIMGRYGNRWLELTVAIIGIVATMPYIALQLVGMEKVIQALGFAGEGWVAHMPLTIAFVILALYTYKSGLRAPAMIAFVKDVMIYIFVIAAVVVIPYKLGGYGLIFDAAGKAFDAKVAAGGGKVTAGLTLAPQQLGPFITLAIGSAFALWMYPHSLTGLLASSGAKAIRRNAVYLPAYSLVLGLLGLMGFMAHAAGIVTTDAQSVVPLLFKKMFPEWFYGFAFAAVAIGALVPAAMMSIGAANTFTRNVWRPFINPNMTDKEETTLAKLMSLIVKVGALAVIFFMPTKFALDFQLLSGIWMAQVFPAIVFGLYGRRFTGWGLLAGMLSGLGLGTYLAIGPTTWVPVSSLFGWFNAYNGLTAMIVNVVVAFVVSMLTANSDTNLHVETDHDDAKLAA